MANEVKSAGPGAASGSVASIGNIAHVPPAATSGSDPLPTGWRAQYALHAAIDIAALAKVALLELRDSDEITAHTAAVRVMHLSTVVIAALADVNHQRADLHRRLYGLGINEEAGQ